MIKREIKRGRERGRERDGETEINILNIIGEGSERVEREGEGGRERQEKRQTER